MTARARQRLDRRVCLLLPQVRRVLLLLWAHMFGASGAWPEGSSRQRLRGVWRWDSDTIRNWIFLPSPQKHCWWAEWKKICYMYRWKGKKVTFGIWEIMANAGNNARNRQCWQQLSIQHLQHWLSFLCAYLDKERGEHVDEHLKNNSFLWDVYQTVDRLKWVNCGDTNTLIRLDGEKWDLPVRLGGEARQLSRDLISGGHEVAKTFCHMFGALGWGPCADVVQTLPLT